MSEADFKREFDANFFAAWADTMGDIDATYTPPGGIAQAVQVLVDTNVAQFGDDLAPVATYSTVISFLRAQVEPEAEALVTVSGTSYRLVQRLEGSDESRSRWGAEHA